MTHSQNKQELVVTPWLGTSRANLEKVIRCVTEAAPEADISVEEVWIRFQLEQTDRAKVNKALLPVLNDIVYSYQWRHQGT